MPPVLRSKGRRKVVKKKRKYKKRAMVVVNPESNNGWEDTLCGPFLRPLIKTEKEEPEEEDDGQVDKLRRTVKAVMLQPKVCLKEEEDFLVTDPHNHRRSRRRCLLCTTLEPQHHPRPTFLLKTKRNLILIRKLVLTDDFLARRHVLPQSVSDLWVCSSCEVQLQGMSRAVGDVHRAQERLRTVIEGLQVVISQSLTQPQEAVSGGRSRIDDEEDDPGDEDREEDSGIAGPSHRPHSNVEDTSSKDTEKENDGEDSQLPQAQEKNETDRVICEICGKSITKHFLKTHMLRQHQGGGKYQCDQCGKRFLQQSFLDEHEVWHIINDVGENKSTTCDKCGVSFKTVKELKSHHRKNHLPPSSFLCSICGRGYLTALRLRKHEIVTHPEEIVKKNVPQPQTDRPKRKRSTPSMCPFTCILCSTELVGVVAFHRHSLDRNIHGEETASQCLSCGEKFHTVMEKKKHFRRVHRGKSTWKCPFCPKTFHERSRMRNHARVHTQEKPFKCPRCDRAFAHNQMMKQHFQTFCTPSGQRRDELREKLREKYRKYSRKPKPLACPTCGKGYITLEAMNTHIQKHHPEEEGSSTPRE